MIELDITKHILHAIQGSMERLAPAIVAEDHHFAECQHQVDADAGYIDKIMSVPKHVESPTCRYWWQFANWYNENEEKFKRIAE